MFRHDELEDGVTQELEPLIVEVMSLRLVAETRMRQRFREEERIAKLVTDSFLEWIHRFLLILILILIQVFNARL